MKKLVKVALGAVAFLGITELYCVETVAMAGVCFVSGLAVLSE